MTRPTWTFPPIGEHVKQICCQVYLPSEDDMSTSIFDLPPEVIFRITNFLPLSSIYRLGATCRQLHRVILEDEWIWRHKVLTELDVLLVQGWDGGSMLKSLSGRKLSGVILDPCLEGNRDVYLLHSQDLMDALKSKRVWQAGSNGGWFRNLLSTWGVNPPSDTDIAMRRRLEKPSRFAILGPGTESPETGSLVRRIILSIDSKFSMLNFIPGLPGGIGSGVRIDLSQTYMFDMMCLYTGWKPDRLRRRYQTAENNVLLADNVMENQAGPGELQTMHPSLHRSIVGFLPTLDGLIFTVDVTAQEWEADSSFAAAIKAELHAIMTEMERGHPESLPLLVLCCQGKSDTKPFDLAVWAGYLGLDDSNTPWALYAVNAANIVGLDTALEWIIFHLLKRDTQLLYHKRIGQSRRLPGFSKLWQAPS